MRYVLNQRHKLYKLVLDLNGDPILEIKELFGVVAKNSVLRLYDLVHLCSHILAEFHGKYSIWIEGSNDIFNLPSNLLKFNHDGVYTSKHLSSECIECIFSVDFFLGYCLSKLGERCIISTFHISYDLSCCICEFSVIFMDFLVANDIVLTSSPTKVDGITYIISYPHLDL